MEKKEKREKEVSLYATTDPKERRDIGKGQDTSSCPDVMPARCGMQSMQNMQDRYAHAVWAKASARIARSLGRSFRSSPQQQRALIQTPNVPGPSGPNSPTQQHE